MPLNSSSRNPTLYYKDSIHSPPILDSMPFHIPKINDDAISLSEFCKFT